MLRQLTHTLIVAALVFSIGLHWVVLHSAAQAGMIVSYSVREGSLVTGLSQTFDVEHPCALCVAVAFGMKQEKNDPKQQEETSKKLLLVLTLSAWPVLTPPPFVIFKTEVTHTAVEQFAKCCSQLETAHEL